MANNVQFQSSVPATPSSATIVETVDQGGGVQRQRVSIGDGTVAVSSGTLTLSSAATVTPSSAIQVSFVGIPSVSVASGTITLSSNPTVILSSAVTIGSGNVGIIGNTNVANVVSGSSAVTSTMPALVVALSTLGPVNATVTPSSNFTVIPSSAVQVTLTSNVVAVSSGTVTLSSNPTITSVSSGSVSIISGANTANVVSGSSAVTSTMSALVVALSTLGSFTFTGSSQVLIIGGSAAQNTANVLSGSSTVTSTMASLVVSLSSNGAGIIGTGTPTTPSSQYISAIVQGDLVVGGANSSASNPVPIGGTYNSTNPTAVTSGQRVEAWFDKSGKMIVNSALRALKGVTVTAISSSTTETNITPSSSGGNLLDLYGLILANRSTSVQEVTIKDSSGGTTKSFWEVPANDTRGFMVPADSAIPQSASSQAWTATLSNSSGTFQVTALYVTNV